MHPDVWRSSGHVGNFNDPLVDCLVCQERFRADKAPKTEPGALTPIELGDKGRAKLAFDKVKDLLADANATGAAEGELKRDGHTIHGTKAKDRGYACPNCGSPFLSLERNFNGMFRSSLGPTDPMKDVIDALKIGVAEGKGDEELRALADQVLSKSSVYLRPETAQGMFVQFQNVQQSQSIKVPFGIAQMGKSFRNEITVEHFIFRSCEFEQMEMEFFCEPGTGPKWLEYWKDQRLFWWKSHGVSRSRSTAVSSSQRASSSCAARISARVHSASSPRLRAAARRTSTFSRAARARSSSISFSISFQVGMTAGFSSDAAGGAGSVGC
jgi:glycyl-tRNA synthetase